MAGREALRRTVLVHLAWLAAFCIAYPTVGPPLFLGAVLVVTWSGSLHGARIGVISGAALAALQLFLMWFLLPETFWTTIEAFRGTGAALVVLIGFVVGRAADLRRAAQARVEAHASAERRLAQREAELSAVVHGTDALIGAVDAQLVVRTLNGALREAVRQVYAVDVSVGDALAGRLPDGAPPIRAMRRALAGESIDLEGRWRAGNAQRSAEVHLTPIRSGALITGVAIFGRDTSRQRELEASLRRADRLATVGTLATGVAHEINNPLAYVTTNVDWLRDELPTLVRQCTVDNPEEYLKVLEETAEGVERVQRIVSDLRTFARDDVEGVECDVREVVASTVNLAMSRIRRSAELTVEHTRPYHAAASPGRLGQILLNLVVNAAQAIPEGSPGENRITIRSGDDGEGGVYVEVEDTGIGMTAGALERAFDPFYTTKGLREGTGLGLSICHNLVEAMGGRLTLQSEVGLGTTARIVLPSAETPVPEVVELNPTPPNPGVARILVVDDEPLIGRALARVFREHDVTVVTDGLEALPLLQRESFSVILCDVLMPGMGGPALYEAVRSKDPTLAERFVFVTGGTLEPRDAAFLQAVPNPVYRKPFAVDVLREAVAARLAAPSAAQGPRAVGARSG